MKYYKVFCVKKARDFLIENGYSISAILLQNGKQKIEAGDYLRLTKCETDKFLPFGKK